MRAHELRRALVAARLDSVENRQMLLDRVADALDAVGPFVVEEGTHLVLPLDGVGHVAVAGAARQLRVELGVHFIELDGERTAPRLAPEDHVPRTAALRPFPVELESRQEQGGRLDDLAKGVAFPLRGLGIDRGDERPAVTSLALHQSELRETPQDPSHRRQLDAEHAHDFLLRAVGGQLAAVAGLGDGHEELLVLLVLEIAGVELGNGSHRLAQREASVGASLHDTLLREQVEGAAHRGAGDVELAAEVELHQVIARVRPLFLQQMKDASRQLGPQPAGLQRPGLRGPCLDRTSVPATDAHDQSPSHPRRRGGSRRSKVRLLRACSLPEHPGGHVRRPVGAAARIALFS